MFKYIKCDEINQVSGGVLKECRCYNGDAKKEIITQQESLIACVEWCCSDPHNSYAFDASSFRHCQRFNLQAPSMPPSFTVEFS